MNKHFLKYAGFFSTGTILAITSGIFFQRYFGRSRAKTHHSPPKQQPGDSPFVEQLAPENPLRQDLQTLDDGVGPLFYRRYQVRIRKARCSPADVMHGIRADINRFVPPELARFEKTLGHPQSFRAGDHHQIHILGPWNGPVKTLHNTETHFVFGTRKGHLEAGEIHFKTHAPHRGELQFEIHSWSRSKDEWVDLAYDKIGVAQDAQTAMWVFFCKEVVKASGGEQQGDVDIFTERRERETLTP